MLIELTHDDPAVNCFRRYRLRPERTLFGDLALVIEWGRAGRAPRTRVERFPSEAALNRRFWALLERRRRHGYVPLLAPGHAAAAP